jgi:hypothetical protein
MVVRVFTRALESDGWHQTEANALMGNDTVHHLRHHGVAVKYRTVGQEDEIPDSWRSPGSSMREMRDDRTRHRRFSRLQADRNRSTIALPGFLDQTTAPPIHGAPPHHILDRTHVHTPVYRRVIQSRFNAPVCAG